MEEIEKLDQVRLACPDIARACDLARVFTDMVRNRRGRLLPDWVRRADIEWSSGIVERHVNRVKTTKRAMYGRASFRLPRIRILTRP
ncbi:hypothetical protein ACFWVC_21750 [Streptomyces sp. NPDC058691]|uniref:hypothetical protein n=1 Tax=Streptomyces sp. NPDC058691 TaxID=3346601 RepID=UPI003647A226